MALDKKTIALFKLMEIFLDVKKIDLYESEIYYKTNLAENASNRRKLDRYLSDLEMNYDHIITIKKGHRKVWKLVSVSDIFEEFIKNSEDLSQLFLMAQDFDPEILKELEKGTFSKVAKNDENVFLFKNSIMEELQNDEVKQIFKNLKSAIKNHEYRDIVYQYDKEKIYENEKCLKLIFMNHNWYLAVIDSENILRFRRVSFISKIKYSKKNTFQIKDLEPYFAFLKNIQNAMTLYGVENKVATIKATPFVAKYFDKGMKKYLSSQTFLRKEEDGSVIFTLEYTQSLEILPLIQRWLPDLVILEPKELRDEYKKKLETALAEYE
jgi:predicted DNA-binding transcriptional regulator YafY